MINEKDFVIVVSLVQDDEVFYVFVKKMYMLFVHTGYGLVNDVNNATTFDYCEAEKYIIDNFALDRLDFVNIMLKEEILG